MISNSRTSGPRVVNLSPALTALAVLGIALLAGAAAAYSSVAAALLMGIPLLALSLWFSPEPLVLITLLTRRITDINPLFGMPSPLAMNSSIINAGIAAVLVGAAFVWCTLHRSRLARVPLALPGIVMLIVSGASALMAPDRANGIQQWLRLLSYVSIYLLVLTSVRDRHQVLRFITCLFLATVVPNLAGLYEVYTSAAHFGHLSVARMYRYVGSGPVHAESLIIPILLAWMFYFSPALRKARLLYLLLLLTLAVPFFFTLARAAWAGSALGLLAVSLFLMDRRRSLRPILFLVTILAVAALSPVIQQRYLLLSDPGLDSSLVDRLASWDIAFRFFRSSPILGVGLGTVDQVAGLIAYSRALVLHNDLIRILADMGIVGIAVYLWLMLTLLWTLLATYRAVRSPLYRAVLMAGVAMWIAFQVAGLFNPTFTNSVIQYGYWGFAGLCLALPATEATELAYAKEHAHPVSVLNSPPLRG
jgi:O-antigen ligase